MNLLRPWIFSLLAFSVSSPLLSQTKPKTMHLIKLDFPDVGTRSTFFKGLSLELVIENMIEPKPIETKLLQGQIVFKRPRGSTAKSFQDREMLSFDKVYVGNVIYRDDSGSPSIFTTAIVIDLNGKLKNTVVGRIVIYPKENKILLLSDSREQIPYPADFDSLNAKRIYALRPIRKIIEAQALKPDASFEPAKSATEQLRRCRKAAEHIAR